MLDRVKTSLRDKGLWSDIIDDRIREFEHLCLAQIRSEQLRNVVVDYLETATPVEFFVAPASSTGKYHPEWQSEIGGILLNTVECCVGIDRKLRMYPELTDATANPLPADHDIVYVATILSDTFKPLDSGRNWQDWSHHRLAAEKWSEFAELHKVSKEISEKIASAIYWHLGRFTPEWPPGEDPRSKLHIHAFITHELDMDFSNRKLSDVFERKRAGRTPSSLCDPCDFLRSEFETSANYFNHIESKLLNMVTYYTTLLIAVVSASSFVAGSSTFGSMTFGPVREPQEFFVGLATFLFFLIGIFLLGMYTELRVRKIRFLEEMAAIRSYFVATGKKLGVDISRALIMVTNVAACPPFLRRPSEDWYTVVVMIFVNAIALGCAIPLGYVAFGLPSNLESIKDQVLLPTLGLVFLVALIRWQFRWVTKFCFVEDCRRELIHGKRDYKFLVKHPTSFPLGLRFLDSWAKRIEVAEKPIVMELLKSRSN